MPRRRVPDPLAKLVGARIRQLREEAGLTIEKLAYESDLGPKKHGSKGHLSSIEKGLVIPTVRTLKVLADRLDVLPLDLMNLPDEDERQRLIERTRSMTKISIRKLLKMTE